MKKIYSTLIIAICLVGSIVAQNFNGHIQFEIDYKGSGVEQFKAMLPNSYDYYFLNGDMMMRINGGMAAAMMGDFIVYGKAGEAYMVKHTESKAYKIEGDKNDKKKEGEESDVKVEDTGETMEIMGYTCKKYKVTSGDATQYMYVAEELKISKPKKAADLGSGGSMFVDKIEGFPLKMEMTMNQGGMTITMVMTAVDVDDSKPSKDLFEIPGSYQIAEFNPAMFGF